MANPFSPRTVLLHTIALLGGRATVLEVLDHAEKHFPSLYERKTLENELFRLAGLGEIVSVTCFQARSNAAATIPTDQLELELAVNPS